MRKKQKNIAIGVVVALAIAFLFLASNSGFKLFSTATSCYGGSDITITKIERTPGASTFKVTAIANGGGECAKIAWTKDDINYYLEQASPDEIADKGVYMDIVLNSMQEKFGTSLDTTRNVNKYNFADLGVFTSCTVSNAQNSYPTTEFVLRATTLNPFNSEFGHCFAVYTSKYGNVGTMLGAKSRVGKATIYVSGFSPVQLSYGDVAGTFSTANGKINGQWTGDLVGGRWIGTPGYNLFNNGGSYSLISNSIGYQSVAADGDMTIYANGESWNNLKACLQARSGWEWTSSKARACADAFNTELTKRLIDRLSEYKSGTSSYGVTNAYFDGSNFVVDQTPYSTSFPRFTFTIDATWVGVHYVLGKPQVTCPTGTVTLKSGTTSQIPLTVTNIDSKENGAFALEFSCGTFSTTLSTNRVLLSPGQSNSILGSVTTTTTNEQSQTCNFKATTVKPSDRISQCSFSVKAIPDQRCIPNIEKKCSDDFKQIGVCNSQGTDFIFSLCQNGCEYKDGSAQCVGQICKKEGEPALTGAECCIGLVFDNSTKTCKKPEDVGVCKTCDDFVLSKVFGSFSQKYQCTPKQGSITGFIFGSIIDAILPGRPINPDLQQNEFTCFFSFLKIGISGVVLIFGSILFNDYLSGRKGASKKKGVNWLIAILVSAVVAFLNFTTVLFGVGFLVVLLILRMRR